MDPLSHEGKGAIGAPATIATPQERVSRDTALRFSRDLPFVTSDVGLAVIAFAVNQAVAGQVTFAHLMGELVHAQARELSTAGARTLPEGPLRDAVATIANLEAGVAASVIDAANRYGRRFAHLAFAFPVPARGTY